MKQANVPALSRFVDSAAVDRYFEHEGHRTVVSQRALQVHTDPLLGYAEIDGVGYVVSEVSPYEVDLDWENITEPDDMAAVVDLLGRATAKVHCASDEDSDQDLVDFQVEAAIVASLQGPPARLHRPHRRLRPVVRRDGAPRPCAVRRCLPERTHRGRRDLDPALSEPARRPARRRRSPARPSRGRRTPWRRQLCTASTRSSGTSAIADPPKPPPVIRAPSAPAWRAVSTATSSSSQETS